MTFSVALCTYNSEKFLAEQLESLLAQTRPPDEIIICDDASTDATPALLRDFAAYAPFRVRIQCNAQNIGVIANFEQAIAACTGDLIALCDQDDIWLPHKLARIERVFQAYPHAGMVFSDATVIDESGQFHRQSLWGFLGFAPHLRNRLHSKSAFPILLTRAAVTGATMAFRAEYRPLILPIDSNGPLLHDAWIATLLAAVSEIVPLREPLLSYRRHPAQQTYVEGSGGFMRGNDYYVRHGRQLEIMKERLQHYSPRAGQSSSAPPGNVPPLRHQLRVLDERLRHMQARLDMSSSRIQRLPKVARELLSGRYHRHSNGWRSAVRDLVLVSL